MKGNERLLLIVNNFAERYGNDIPEVDDLARDLAQYFHDEFAQYTNTRGGKFRVGFWSVTANFNLGMNTGATPDGKRKGEPLSDSLAPNAGKDVFGHHGIFAVGCEDSAGAVHPTGQYSIGICCRQNSTMKAGFKNSLIWWTDISALAGQISALISYRQRC